MKKGFIFVIFIIFLLLPILLYINYYNLIISANENVSALWAQVENQLQRRYDLIPNLVNIVKGYAKHEKEVFEKISEARTRYAGARTINEKINANQELDNALSRLLVIIEQYPNLKANENFIRLQDELAGTENRIAVARQRYNESVRDYNILIKRFPGNIVAKIAGFERKDAYFKPSQDVLNTSNKILFE